ncbi:MAG: histidine phosphatase family protein [Paracoccaceae bacterium]
MKQIILMRHAKSSWDDPALDDFDRPLGRRGRLAASLMGAWLAERNPAPDHVLLSGAARTAETWARAARVLGDVSAPVVSDRRLYMAAPETMLEVLRALPDDAATVLLIGHQPSLGSLARLLSAESAVPEHCRQAFSHFPTAAAAVLESPVSAWSELDFGAAAFAQFARPKDLV